MSTDSSLSVNEWDKTGFIIDINNNTYILIAQLGKGSYATVWSCYHVNTKEIYAIKIFKCTETKTANKEIMYYNKCNKIINMIQCINSFEYNNKICIVLELMIGSLYDVIQNGISNDIVFSNGFDVKFVVKVTYNILKTLKCLHANNIIHGDIKPDNILLYGKTEEYTNLLKIISTLTTTKISETLCKLYNTTSNVGISKNNSNSSEMSMPPAQISMSDSEYSCVSSTQSDKEHKYISYKYIENPIIKISDLGGCVDITIPKKPIGIQTKYYKSPELILALDYNMACDIWALGCTIYELLSGNILFDPDDYDIDEKRCMLHKIYAYIGNIPDIMINNSPIKQVFYTNTNILKGSIKHETYNIWIPLIKTIKCETNIKYMLIDLLLDMLTINPADRVTAHNALEHPLFTYMKLH